MGVFSSEDAYSTGLTSTSFMVPVYRGFPPPLFSRLCWSSDEAHRQQQVAASALLRAPGDGKDVDYSGLRSQAVWRRVQDDGAGGESRALFDDILANPSRN